MILAILTGGLLLLSAGPEIAPPPRAVVTRPVAPAPRLVVAVPEAAMKDVWLFVETYATSNGRMPSAPATYAALVEAKSPATEWAKMGAIVLTGTTERRAIWAYECRAITYGGLVLTANGVERMTATDLNKLLGGK